MKVLTVLILLSAFPLMAAKRSITPIQNASLFSNNEDSDLRLKQQKFLGDEDLDARAQGQETNIQRQEESPSQIRIKEMKKEERRDP